MDKKFGVAGTLYSKSKTREVGANNYPIREFVIHIPNRDNPKYDEHLPFVLKGPNYVKKIDGFEKNTFLSVEAIPTGKMWTDKKGNEKPYPSFNAVFIAAGNQLSNEQEQLSPFPELDNIGQSKTPF